MDEFLVTGSGHEFCHFWSYLVIFGHIWSNLFIWSYKYLFFSHKFYSYIFGKIRNIILGKRGGGGLVKGCSDFFLKIQPFLKSQASLINIVASFSCISSYFNWYKLIQEPWVLKAQLWKFLCIFPTVLCSSLKYKRRVPQLYQIWIQLKYTDPSALRT